MCVNHCYNLALFNIYTGITRNFPQTIRLLTDQFEKNNNTQHTLLLMIIFRRSFFKQQCSALFLSFIGKKVYDKHVRLLWA